MSETILSVAELEVVVAAMRRLGVTEWNGIVLGTAPVEPGPEEDPIQRSKDLEQVESERRKRLRFAASGGPAPLRAKT